ncbi:CYFA0S22e01706g1_1 [Cyberlindnera fabianii]|uniref:CYFA0S22e01706g1_1 n=1 Tax=Cyberlindnera fabianii TaxID=36022 RepID=A0A061B8K0_CYBFA|nr:CYFA0S22e01706g1_1 [Cyberlindnera fabianii]
MSDRDHPSATSSNSTSTNDAGAPHTIMTKEEQDQSPSSQIDPESLEKKDSTTISQEKDVTTQEIHVPEGGRQGWMTVAAVFFFNCATWAANSAYAAYLAHYLQYDTFKGASKLDYSAIGGIAFGCGLFLSPLFKLLIRATSVRKTIFLGGVCQFVGIMLAAFSTKLWEIYLTQGVLIGFGLAAVTMPAMTIIPQWFRKKRSLAVAIAATGSGIGGVIFNLGIQAIIKNISLRWALIIQAIMCATCVTLGLCLLRTRYDEIKTSARVWDSSMLRHKIFWMFGLYIALTMLGYVVLMYNLADFTISLGYSAHQGSIVSCMISVGIVFGRPIVGRLSDRFGTVTTSIFAHMIVGILCLAMWIPARNLATAIAFALLQGGMMGSIWVVLAPMATRLVGLRKLEVALCMMWIGIGAFGIVSPVIGIELRSSPKPGVTTDPTIYKYASVWCGCVYLGSAIVLWLIRAYLITRDREAEKQSSHEDNDELSIPVGWDQLVSNLFSVSKTRKV